MHILLNMQCLDSRCLENEQDGSKPREWRSSCCIVFTSTSGFTLPQPELPWSTEEWKSRMEYTTHFDLRSKENAWGKYWRRDKKRYLNSGIFTQEDMHGWANHGNGYSSSLTWFVIKSLRSIPQDCKKSNKQRNPIEYLEPQNQKDAWEVFLCDDNKCHPQHPSSSSTEKKRFTW